MTAMTAPENLRLLADVSGRSLAFLVLVGLSVPLSAELASALPSLLPELGIREGQFGPFVNDYVLDVMANWPLWKYVPITKLAAVPTRPSRSFGLYRVEVLADDAPIIHEAWDNNLAFRWVDGGGDVVLDAQSS